MPNSAARCAWSLSSEMSGQTTTTSPHPSAPSASGCVSSAYAGSIHRRDLPYPVGCSTRQSAGARPRTAGRTTGRPSKAEPGPHVCGRRGLVCRWWQAWLVCRLSAWQRAAAGDTVAAVPGVDNDVHLPEPHGGARAILRRANTQAGAHEGFRSGPSQASCASICATKTKRRMGETDASARARLTCVENACAMRARNTVSPSLVAGSAGSAIVGGCGSLFFCGFEVSANVSQYLARKGTEPAPSPNGAAAGKPPGAVFDVGE